MKNLDKRQILGWIAVGLSIVITCVWASWGISETFHCMFWLMPTINSDGCRPLVLNQADHQFWRYADHFFEAIRIGGRHRSDSVDGMIRILA